MASSLLPGGDGAAGIDLCQALAHPVVATWALKSFTEVCRVALQPFYESFLCHKSLLSQGLSRFMAE